MKETKKIHNLDSLEREIFRLELESRRRRDRIEHNIDWIGENYSTLFFKYLFRKKKSGNDKGGSTSFFKNEKLNFVVDKLTDHLSNKMVDGLDKMINRIFRKKKK